MVQEVGNPKVSAISDMVSGKNPLPGSQIAIFLLYSHTAEEVSCFGDSYQGTTLIHKHAILVTYSLPKGPTSSYHCIGVRFQLNNFLGGS